jgi:magnesium chelatase subunit I
LIEQVSFEARSNEFVDKKSGVSARLTIAAFENAISSAERRAIIHNEKHTYVWISDLMGIIPSITGKIELVYEGEQEGTAFVANHLIGEATKTLFLNYFPKIEKLKKQNQETPYD